MNLITKFILFLISNVLFFNIYAIDNPKNLIVKKLNKGKVEGIITEINDLVIVNYTGWIFNENINTDDFCKAKGEMFDSSIYDKFNHKNPFTFLLGKGLVIKGWDNGLKKMKIGEKRCLVIPPRFAYGNRRIGDIIKPNSTLIFEVELLEIIKAKK